MRTTGVTTIALLVLRTGQLKMRTFSVLAIFQTDPYLVKEILNLRLYGRYNIGIVVGKITILLG